MESSLSINAFCVDFKRHLSKINVPQDVQVTKLGVEPHVTARQDIIESMESAESSTAVQMSFSMELNAFAFLATKESTPSAELSHALQIKF